MLTREVFSGDCRSQILAYIDGLTRASLIRDDIPLDTQLGDIGFGPQKCAWLEVKVRAEQRARGKPEIPGGTIKVTTTVGEVIGYVCD
ncbi:hypothetical protein JMG10_31930 [Nostoc ellipsosporum NOK]|uniref:hypothetical protein n=1 Tax=Sphingomonas sp. IBVSS2 TaxID=1985172 RepID=UPI000A2D98E6|nr:hypothetical protein [Sphingomonas sp. IBVSS2]MDF2386120.1 hypothetical protein [Nostoc ellipsosporum NOK]OSZ64369.1 hypothetical protein CAP40_17085 [Sphingomonas sp. IBVSS2]